MPVVKGERAARPTAYQPAPPPRPDIVEKPAPVQSPGAIKTAAEPRAPEALAPKLEKPVPALQQHNFQGGINQFNERVQSVHDSYTSAYGVAPSPGLTFDLATSKVDVKDFQRMFTVPQSQFAAKNRGTLTAQGIHTIPDPAYSAKDIADQIVKAAAQGDYHSFVEQNIDTIHDLSSAHKDDAATIAGAIFKARRLETFREVETKVNNGDLTPGQGREQLQAMGMIPGGSAFHALKGVGGELALGIGQIADSLVHSPAGLYELGKAAGLDTRDIVLHPGSSDHFSRTAPIGKAMGHSVVKDVTHPAENPGYLFLDILGFAAPIAGTGARVAEAGRVLRAGSTEATVNRFLDLQQKTTAGELRVEKMHGGPYQAKPGETSVDSDWKAFSRRRGYTEAEIKDFAKWLELNKRYPGLQPDMVFKGKSHTSEEGIREHLAQFGSYPDVAGAAKALVKKPPLRRVTLRHGDITEEMPLSQNPAVALVQELFVKGRQAGADKRLAVETPSALRSVLVPQIAQDFLDKNLSFETKIGREADARKRVDHIVATTLSRELDHVAGRAVTQARIQSAVPSRIRGSLTRGEQKAIQVQSWDDPNPLQAERAFHQRMIEMGVGDPKAHRTQLADLKLAEKALANPSPRLVKALELTRRVVADMEEIKIRDLGLLAETAEGRVAKAGAVLRGEDIVPTEVPNPAYAEMKASGETLLHGTNRDFSTFGGEAAVNRYGRADKLAQRRSYFTTDKNVAETMAHSGAYSQVDAYKFEQVDHASDLDVPRLRRALDAQIKKGKGLFYTDDNGRLVAAKSAADVPESSFFNQDDIRLYSKKPRVIKAKVYGKTLDLTEHVPADLAAALKKEGRFDPTLRASFNHEHSQALIAYAEKHGYGKIVVHDASESGFRSTIVLHDYIEHGGRQAAIFKNLPKTVRDSGLSKQLRTTDKSKVVDVVPLERTNPDSFYLPTQRRGKVKRPPSDRAGYFPVKAGPFGIPPGRAMPELTHEFTGKAIQAGDFRIDATSLATEAYGRTVRAATVRAEHSKLWDSASLTEYGRHSVPIRDVNEIPDKLREVIARLDEGDFGPKDAEILPADMRELIEALYPDKRKMSPEEIDHVRWIDARLLGEGNSMPHIPGLAAKVAQTVQAPVRFTTLYLRPAYILNKLGNHAMLLFDQGWMAIPNYAKALNMDARYGEEATRTIHELVGAGKSQSYVTGSSGKVSQAVAEFWNKIADRGERAASFIYYMERKGYKTREQVDALLHDPANRADLVEIKRRSNKALVEFDNLLPIEKNYIRHFIFVYPWVSRSAVWSIRAALEHPLKTDILAHLGEQELDSDPIFKQAPAWFKRVGYIPVGWNGDGTPRVINPTSVNTFSTLGDFVSFAKASTVGDKYASAEDFLGPFPKFLIHGVTGRDEFGNKYPGSQWADAAKAVLVGLPQVSAYQRAGKEKQGTGKLPNVADRSSLETSLNASLRATVMSPGWLQGYGTLIAGGVSPRDVNLPALAARYWGDQDPKVRHTRELDLLNRALTIQGEVLKQDVPKAVRAAVADQANLDYEYKTFLKQNGRVPSDKERADFTITYLTKQGMLPKGKAAEWRKKLAPLADTSDISRLKNHLLDTYANGKALRAWDTDVRTVASFRKDVFNQKVAELHKQGLADQSVYQGSQDKLYDYGRKYLAFTREAKRMQAAGAPTADLRAFQDKNDVPVNGLPSFVRMAWANQTPDQQKQAVTSAAARSWRDNTAFDKALLGRPSDAKVTAGWAKLQEIIDTQKADLKRQGRSFPAGYARTLAQYVEKYYDAPGLVKDYDFSKKPLADRLKYLAPVQKSPHRGEWTQLLNTAQTYAKWLDAKNADGSKTYSGLQVRQSWTDYIHGDGFQSWLGEHPQFKAELQGYGKTFLNGLI